MHAEAADSNDVIGRFHHQTDRPVSTRDWIRVIRVPKIGDPITVLRELLRIRRFAGPLMPLMDADAADQERWSPAPDHHHRFHRRQTKLLFISGFSAFSGISGLSISDSL